MARARRLAVPGVAEVHTTREVVVHLDDEPRTAREGESVACSLWAAGETVFSRSVKYHRPRGPFCFTQSCSHCLMRVDGVPNVFTCRVPVQAGMRLERQNAFPTARFDVFAATDWLFPGGLNHHEMLAGVPIAQDVMLHVARQLAGLGTLPDRPAPARPAVKTLEVEVVVVGAGPAGLGAAGVLAGDGVSFVVLEKDAFVGGRLVTGPPEAEDPEIKVEGPEIGSVLTSTVALGIYEDERGFFLVACDLESMQLLRVNARTFLLCQGGHPRLTAFGKNDLPGVFAARAASRLLRRHGVVVGSEPLVVGSGAEAVATVRMFEQVGVHARWVGPGSVGGVEPHVKGTPTRAHGHKRVTGLTVRRNEGPEERLACDAVLLCDAPAPAFELARHAGAEVVFDSAQGFFRVVADSKGKTREPRVYVAGELLAPGAAVAAYESGRRAARDIVASSASRAQVSS